MIKKVLVVVAHPDDEVLGCGGTIARHIAIGDKVFILLMTNGVDSRNASEQDIKSRQQAAKNSANIFKAASIQQLNFPDNKMDSVAILDVVISIEDVIDKLQPDTIYTHHIGDLNVDHQITHKAVMTACRPQPNFCVKEIYSFEVLSSTEWQTPGVDSFNPNVFVDITRYIETKKNALEAYSEEMRDFPHTRSIDNVIRLSLLRGGAVGVEYAEAFMLLRLIKDEI